MTELVRQRRKVVKTLLFISSVAWILVITKPVQSICVCRCRVSGFDFESNNFWDMVTNNLLAALLVGWALMLVAMMLPTLTAAVMHVKESSFKRRQMRSIVLFAIGYMLVWILAGVLLLQMQLLIVMIAPNSIWPIVAVGLIALIWQCTPVKQMCLNRNHSHRELAAFGLAADLDAVRFGFSHGYWCVCSCWLLMLLPLLFSGWHNIVMGAAMFLMVSESLEKPRLLTWRLPVSGKLGRILFAQWRIKLKSWGSGLIPSSTVPNVQESGI